MKADIYQTITDKIVSQIEAGAKPWQMPWTHCKGSVSRPLRHNGQPYSGVNVLILWVTAEEKGYKSRYWMTYKQAAEMGAQVRKGEKAEHIVYANTYTKTETNAQGEESERNIPFLRSYAVFNADQIDGLPEQYYAVPAVRFDNPDEAVSSADQFIANTGAKVEVSGERAFYSPSHDFIGMPAYETFRSAKDYYSTAFHELTHWTRHESTLNREFGRARFGDEGYAMEELVAELGAAFLCADLGLTPSDEPREDHAGYLASWLRVLKNDKRAIFTAASYATKAADYLQSLQASAEEIAA